MRPQPPSTLSAAIIPRRSSFQASLAGSTPHCISATWWWAGACATSTALVAESAPGLEEFASSPALIEAAANALSAHGFIDAASSEADGTGAQFLLGTIATGDRFITGADKDTVVKATHADCVEMEGAAVAHVAAKNGTPCLVLRAISDNCDESYVDLSHRSFDLEEYARTASELVLSILRAL